jgi:hypothetical protein
VIAVATVATVATVAGLLGTFTRAVAGHACVLSTLFDPVMTV